MPSPRINRLCWSHSLATGWVIIPINQISSEPIPPRTFVAREVAISSKRCSLLILTLQLANLIFAHYLTKLLRVQHGLIGVEANLTPVTIAADSIAYWIINVKNLLQNKLLITCRRMRKARHPLPRKKLQRECCLIHCELQPSMLSI
jgi:hypothetical protein